MAGKLMRCVLIAVLIFGVGSGVAWADVDSDSADNAQAGDNSSDTNQGGEAGSGDAVAGQVVGGVSSGFHDRGPGAAIHDRACRVRWAIPTVGTGR